MKIHKLRTFFILSLFSIGLNGCYKTTDDYPIKEKVWVPTYSSRSEMQVIKSLPPQEMKSAGKIYVYNNYLFQVDPNSGIHVFEFEDKVPKPLSFIQLFGAQEIAIKSNILYSNNYEDLVGINIDNVTDVKLVHRVDSAFQLGSSNLPPEHGFFQCVDPVKGIVTGWELKTNIQANCQY